MKANFDSSVFGMKKDSSFDSAIEQIGSGYEDHAFIPPWKKKQLPYYI